MSSISPARDRFVMEPPRRPKRRLLSGLDTDEVLKKQRVYPPFPSPVDESLTLLLRRHERHACAQLEIINDSGTVECAV
jgi:hypothetical protein